MTVKEIVAKWLKENGYDGLCDYGEGCVCYLNDFMPCSDALNPCYCLDECQPFKYKPIKMKKLTPAQIKKGKKLVAKLGNDYREACEKRRKEMLKELNVEIIK